MTFRIIPLQTMTAAQNMAFDEACMESIRDGGPNTIRLYRWKPSAVSIGYFQCLTDEVDTKACKQDGVDIVRRQTGGGAVYHDNEGEVTYSIIGREEDFPDDITESYTRICDVLIEGLANVGIKAEFRPINDLIVGKKKISGNAQTRRNGVLLQHGTILLSVEPERMFRYLTPDKSKLSDKPFVTSVKSAVTSVAQESEATREQVEAALRKAFVKAYDAHPGGWTEHEQDRARELAVHKYGDASWNAMR